MWMLDMCRATYYARPMVMMSLVLLDGVRRSTGRANSLHTSGEPPVIAVARRTARGSVAPELGGTETNSCDQDGIVEQRLRQTQTVIQRVRSGRCFT